MTCEPSLNEDDFVLIDESLIPADLLESALIEVPFIPNENDTLIFDGDW